MGKIWLKGPDGSKQCCGCEGKDGPCSSCNACTGLFYNTVTNLWGPFNNSLGSLPFNATDCFVANDVNDSYIKTSNLLNLDISLAGKGPRSNAFSIKVQSGDILNLNINDSIAANSEHPAQWLDSGGGKFNLFFDRYSGYSTILRLEGTPNLLWGKVLNSAGYPDTLFNIGSNFTRQSSGTISSAVNFRGSDALINPPPINGSYFIGASYRTGVTGSTGFFLSPSFFNDFNPSVCFYYIPTGYPADIGGGNIVADGAVTPTGALFNYVNEETFEQPCTSFFTHWACRHRQWLLLSVTPPTSDLGSFGDISCYTSFYNNFQSILAGLNNANRPLCIDVRLVTDDPGNQQFLDTRPRTVLNGKTCDETITEDEFMAMHWNLKLHYSTSWPLDTPPGASHSKSLQIESKNNSCINILVGEGGTVNGTSFNYISQHISGLFFQETSISIGSSNGINLNPIFYYHNTLNTGNKEDCPFVSLP